MSDAAVLGFSAVSLVIGARRLFDRLDLCLGRGERVAIIGPSGTGKSVIQRLAIGMTPPLTGSVALFGEDLGALPAAAQRRLRGRCGMVFQGGSLIGSLSVEDNLWLALDAAPAARKRLRRRIDRALFDFGIEHAAPLIAGDLSEGERRRGELGRAFVRDPELLILDEPLVGLHADADAIEAVLARQIIARGRALLLLTQDRGLAHRLCERVLLLENGVLVQQDGADAAPFASA
ncbi:ATP-binding cassette domain-containing protein [Novosphingobium colocasiae]|uniref:ATP-binding cassette domain-containing protein n=1 Tax=Novosphingobium colocasiae TaxID=1256513 RepID=UPI0035B3A5F3